LPFSLRTKNQAFFCFLALVNSFFVEIASFLNLSLTSFIGLFDFWMEEKKEREGFGFKRL
jgi:hypothetical protein